MQTEILFIVVTISWIVFGTSFFRWSPIIVLLIASFFLGLCLRINPVNILYEVFGGFVSTTNKIGALILFGAIIGVCLEKSGATSVISIGILKKFYKLPLTYIISIVGFIVSIPVFCDAAFIILSTLNKKLSELSKSSKTSLTVALSTGLFAPHVLVPPTPGPLAAAATLKLDNILFLFISGAILALFLALLGAFYSQNFIKKSNALTKNNLQQLINESESADIMSFKLASSPIWIPILLMSLGSILPQNISIISTPIFSLFIGVLISIYISISKIEFKPLILLCLKQSIPIIAITGMGGALGNIIQNINISMWFSEITNYSYLGILIPFLIAATLKTAQGSSTVSIITTASIVYPMLHIFGLENDTGKVLAILAIGVGSMTASHANDSYFWIVSQVGELEIRTAYKTHTFATLIQGIMGIIILLITNYVLNIF